jgi:hypothetical protein
MEEEEEEDVLLRWSHGILEERRCLNSSNEIPANSDDER